MAIIFGVTLLTSQSMVERIARRKEPNLDKEGVAYTRNVTKVWIGFSLCNAILSLITALYGNLSLWALYNGVISYLLMGSLFIGEYIFRINYKKKAQMHAPQ
jgi:uncharacterized membrane protein